MPQRLRQSLTLVTPPVSEPVTLTEAKAWAKVDDTSDDDLITALITAARMAAEEYLRRALITQTWKLTLDLPCSGIDALLGDGVYDLPQSVLTGDLPDVIELPKGAIQSVASVTSYDTTNASSAYASSNYLVDTAGARLVLNDGSTWPTGMRPYAAMEIIFVAGYGDAATDVPQPIRSGMKIHIASLYEQRGQAVDEMAIPPAAKQIYGQYRIIGGRP